ncbi:MAG: glycosyltransferase [Caldilinea sp.]
MNILILTLGSHGDVQPYVALGRGLQDAGHVVKLVTAEPFEQFVTEHGLTFAPLQGKFLDLIQTNAGRAAIAGKGNALKLMQQVKPMFRQMLDDAWRVADGSDIVIYHPKALGGYSIAEKLGVPPILALPAPLYSPTRSFPSPLLPFNDLGGTLNLASHRITIWLASVSMRGILNQWRKDVLKLPAVKNELMREGRPVLRLYPYSPAVAPMPADWGAHSVATGYWFLERSDEWQPPSDLTTFLENGPPPVYIGFGSMPSEDAPAKTQIILEALRLSGQRGVVATGWGGLTTSGFSDQVYTLEAAPHDWLFPRMAAVVHHGGAGTTAAGLRAGAPTVICTFLGDQPFWGRRNPALGVGPAPILQKKLSAEKLVEALNTVTRDTAMQLRAKSLGEELRREDGIGRAVALIESEADLRPAATAEATIGMVR